MNQAVNTHIIRRCIVQSKNKEQKLEKIERNTLFQYDSSLNLIVDFKEKIKATFEKFYARLLHLKTPEEYNDRPPEFHHAQQGG